MKILVTGGGGYLGSVLVPILLMANYEVTVLDTFGHGCLSLAGVVAHPQLKILRADVRAFPSYLNYDAIIPLAAVVGASACEDNPSAWSTNYDPIVKMCDSLAPEQIVIMPCTNSGYGIGGEEECTEQSKLRPLTDYGKSKVAAETCIMQRANSVSLRLATLFGWSPRMRRDLLVNDLVWRAVRDRTAVIYEGQFRRNFCHVRDAALAFTHVLYDWEKMRGQIYNVGDSQANMTKAALCDKIRERVPGFQWMPATIGEDPDKRDYVVSNAKIEATGWRPRFTLDEGIAELVRGYAMMKREDYGNS